MAGHGGTIAYDWSGSGLVARIRLPFDANVTLTTEQRTRIRQTVLAGDNVPRATNVNFALSVGASVPESVRVVEVSPVLVAYYPEWRGHMYFVVGDEIVIVDRNHRIIAVIAV